MSRAGALDAIGEGRAHPGGLAAQFAVVARWEHEQSGRHADQESDHPAEEPITQWGNRSDAYRQNEDHQRRTLPAGDDFTEKAEKADNDPDNEAQRHRHPGVRRSQCADGDQQGTVDRQPAVAHRAGTAVAGEISGDQQRDAAEDGENRRLGVTGNRETRRGGQRDEDCRAQCLACGVTFGVAPRHRGGTVVKRPDSR